ncbi:ribosome biogenesis protein NOP53-like [Anneissia japonica]|uniref:ribosome biogenesis protein NOP53-like n=1 Tax=Anneissia japonica TaxID=1529436 RepID=UPI00142563C9|nr:ribosome biogenesis protein NOP53-like [Anneissia japonica]
MTELQIKKGPRKRFAKNRKKAWRKHTDIKDVEDFLEDQRMQLRTGGLVSEKKDENLFFVESKPAIEEPEHSKGRRKRVKVEKPLKCHRNLTPNPFIPPVHSPTYTKPKKKGKRVLAKEEAERKGLIGRVKKQKLEMAAVQRQTHKQLKQRQGESRKSGRQEYDLWSGKEVDNVKSPDDGGHYLTITKQKRVKCRRQHLSKTPVPAVEVLPSGASYNPSYEDHQDLLKDALVEAVACEKKEAKVNRWHSFSTVDAYDQQKNWLSEMSEGLFNEEEKQPIAIKESVKEDDTAGKTGTRKTRLQRQKEAKIKEMENKIQKGKDKNIKMHQVYRLKALKNEIKEEEDLMKKKREKKLAVKKQLSKKTKQIGPHKYEAVPISYKLSDELVGSLRELKPEGDMLKECYKDYERRNMVEPRVWKRGTKPNLKTVEKRSHREAIA